MDDRPHGSLNPQLSPGWSASSPPSHRAGDAAVDTDVLPGDVSGTLGHQEAHQGSQFTSPAFTQELKDAGAGSCAHTRSLLQRHLADVDDQIERLRQARTQLAALADRPTLQIAALTGVAAILSAFMNNVGALALVMPIAMEMCERSGRSPSLVLMPIATLLPLRSALERHSLIWHCSAAAFLATRSPTT